jgi:hypothetical protein
MGDYQLLVKGDCLSTLRHLATRQVQAVRFSKATGEEQVASIRKIAGPRRLLPGLHLLVGHDHTDYQFTRLVPYLSEGWLDEEERRALSDYESSVFDGDSTLRPEAMPRSQRDMRGGAIGTVSEPTMR